MRLGVSVAVALAWLALSRMYWTIAGVQQVASALNARNGAGGVGFVYLGGFSAGAVWVAQGLVACGVAYGLMALGGRFKARRAERPRSVTRGLK